MEKFNVNKHWDDFVNDKLIVNCETEKLAKEFLEYCHKQGMKWALGDSLLDKNNWYNYKQQMCYRCEDKEFYYGSFNHYSDCEYTIIKFEGFNKTPTKENIEVIYHNNETIVLIHETGKYYRGVSKCNPEDTYNREYGFLLAYQRARAKELGI